MSKLKKYVFIVCILLLFFNLFHLTYRIAELPSFFANCQDLPAEILESLDTMPIFAKLLHLALRCCLLAFVSICLML